MTGPEELTAQPDITALAIAEQRYRALVRATSSLVWTTAPDGQIVDMPEWRAYTGQSVEQIKGWGWLNSLHPDDRERTAVVWQQAVDTRSFYETDYRIRRSDGVYVWHRARGVPILEADGVIREWVGLCLDIHLRKQAEEKRIEAETALAALTKAAQAIAKGEWREVPEIRGKDEVGLLAQAFNLMTARLREMLDGLRQSEARLEEAQRIAHVGYWQRDLDTNRITWSDETYRIFGLKPRGPEITPPRLQELIHPDDRRSWNEAVTATLKNGARYDVEYRVVRPDGELRIVHSRGDVTRDEAGLPRRIFGTIQDITERKRAEEARRASEERWRMVFETSSVGITTIDSSSRYTSANKAFQQMVGYTEAEMRALGPLDLTHEEDLGPAREVIDDLLAGRRQAYQIEKRYRRKDGEIIWVSVNCSHVPGTDTIPDFYQAIIIDITDRKRAEEALRASEERWRTVFQTASVGIATSDANRRISTANKALQRMLGYTEAELQTLRWPDLTHEDDQLLTKDWITNLEAGRQQAYQVEKRYRRKDGGFIWASLNASYVPATGTTSAFFASIIVDITDRRRAEEGLRRAQTELARVTRATTMGELGASIAHEINQPLAAIVASGDACKRWLESGQNLDRAKESLGRVISDANRASEVIKRIRSLTKNKAPELLRLDLNEVIDEVLALTHGELQAKEVSVRKELRSDSPPVLGDRVQLQQVLLNLIMNGIEAMAAVTDRRRELTIKSQLGDHRDLLVTVQDSGIGFDPNDAERVFDAFFTTKPDGMGMGLSISTSIVEAHGGRLWTSPGVPHGTAFHFTLPTAGANPS